MIYWLVVLAVCFGFASEIAAQDAKLLSSPDWQRQVAVSIAAAVDEYFAKRVARN